MFNLLNRFHNFFVLLILIVITLSCWFYTITGIGMNISAWKMTLMNLNINDFSNSMDMNLQDDQYSNFLDLIFLFFMWFLMMIAMMLPSAIPFIMIFDKISYERKNNQYKYVPTINFAISYLLIWAIFSLFATIIHVLLEFYDMMNVSTLTVGNLFGASLFMLAGIYQMTPLKNSCLRYCRNPIELLSNEKIFDNLGSFYIGIKHGIFCVGCCWPLMLLLFYSGVMNILWIAGLSFYILIEKYIVSGKKLNFLTGVILILFGFRIFFIYLF